MQATARTPKSKQFHPSVVLATASLEPFATVDEVMKATRRSRSFVMEAIASGELIALQHKPGVRGSRLLISTHSVREWLQRSLVIHP